MVGGKKKKDKKEKKEKKVKKSKGGALTGSRPVSVNAMPDPNAGYNLASHDASFGRRPSSYHSATSHEASRPKPARRQQGAMYEDVDGDRLQEGFFVGESGKVQYEAPQDQTYEDPNFEPQGTSADSMSGPTLPPRSATRVSVLSSASQQSSASTSQRSTSQRSSHLSEASAGYPDVSSDDDDSYLNMPGGDDYVNPDDEIKRQTTKREQPTRQPSLPKPKPRPQKTVDKSKIEQFYRAKGQPKLCIDAASTLPSAFEYPAAIEVSPVNGDIYLTDVERCQVIRFHKSGKQLDVIGSHGKRDGQFMEPRGMAMTSDGMLIVSDMVNNRVQLFDGNGQFIRKFGSEGSGMAQFRKPAGIALGDNNILYVADQWNNRIQIWTLEGNYISSFGELGTAKNQFKQPHDVTVNKRTGDVIIADTNNHRIQVMTSEGKHKLTFGENGQLSSPKSVAVDSDGYIVVADDHNFRIQVISPSGEFVHCFGRRGNDDGEFDQLEGVTINPHNKDILVADYYNRRIQVF